MTKPFQRAVYIGRFQPPHREHIATMQEGLEMADRLTVVIGSAHRPRTPRNPWTCKEREEMIRACFSVEENARLNVIHLEDSVYNDTFWAANLQNMLPFGDEKVALLGFKKDESSYYLDMFPQWQFVPHHPKEGHLNATDIREAFFEHQELPRLDVVNEAVVDMLVTYGQNLGFYLPLTKEFKYIRGYKEKWKAAPHPPIFVTTDAVVVKSGHVLVVKRGRHPGKNQLALPGGFLNQDELVVDGCLRELREETKIAVSDEELRSRIKAKDVFDHPHRSLRGRTISHAFLIDLGVGALPMVKGSDDAELAFWMPLADVYRKSSEFFEDHQSIIHNLTCVVK
jgi:bifunctional NMN adenylyltransferase/nudix hydrolase